MNELVERMAPHVAGFFPVRTGESLDQYATRARTDGLTCSQRSMIAVQLWKASKSIRQEHQSRKGVWIAAARLAFEPSDRRPCEVSGKYRSLSQAHHVVPLAVQFDSGCREPINDHTWLCPTHHTAIHLLIDHVVDRPDRARPATINLIDDLEVKEVRAVVALLERFKEWFYTQSYERAGRTGSPPINPGSARRGYQD
jgi:hypothetical protein